MATPPAPVSADKDFFGLAMKLLCVLLIVCPVLIKGNGEEHGTLNGNWGYVGVNNGKPAVLQVACLSLPQGMSECVAFVAPMVLLVLRWASILPQGSLCRGNPLVKKYSHSPDSFLLLGPSRRCYEDSGSGS